MSLYPLPISQERDYRRRVENYTTIFEPLDQSEMVAERSYSYFKCDHSRHHFVVSVIVIVSVSDCLSLQIQVPSFIHLLASTSSFIMMI